MNQTLIDDIKYVLEKTGESPGLVYVYPMPFDADKINADVISQEVGKEIKIHPVNMKEKHDPENRAKKSKPGKPSIYIE